MSSSLLRRPVILGEPLPNDSGRFPAVPRFAFDERDRTVGELFPEGTNARPCLARRERHGGPNHQSVYR